MRKTCFLLSFLLVSFLQVIGQSRTITGRVVDENDQPIADVSVSVKGTSLGTKTNADGRFTLQAAGSNVTLVISHSGRETREVTVSSDNFVSATLPAANASMEEIVVVGYGTQTKRDQTGAVSSLSGRELETRPFSSFDKMLQGEIPGLLSVAGSGQPGATQNVRLRGIGSINASAAPLYVIDGVPVVPGDISRLTTTANTFAGINPNDIESVTVLKDAASASIYGSQAANGVILITTKKGKSGKSKVRFDAEFGQNDFAYYNDLYKPLNAAEWAMITKEGLINAGNRVGQADTAVRLLNTYGASDRGYDTDWLDLVTRKGKQSQYNLSVSGGSDKGTYYVSGGYYTEEGIAIGSDFKRYTAALRGRNFVSKRFTVTTDLSVGSTLQHGPSNGSAFANPVYLALVLMPTRPAYNPDGSINISDFDFLNLPFNPLYLAEHDKRELSLLKGVGNITGEYKLLDGLKFTSRFGIDYNNLEESQYNNPYHGDGRNDFGRGYSYYTRNFSWVWSNFADYARNLTSLLNLDFKVGYEAFKQNILNNSLRADGFPPSMDLTLAGNAATPKTASATMNDKRRLSAFTSLNLNYDNRYIVSGSFRRDGSSVFGSANRYGNFWSVGASWNVDRESWFESLISTINALKIRASYGANGNESGFGYYEPLTTYGFGFNYNGQTGSAPNNVGDPNLTWELNKPLNIGLDLLLLKNKLSVTADYYHRTTSDLILGANTSRTTGWASYTTNIGEMVNKGVELGIKATPVSSRNFEWTVNVNYARNKNEITALYQNKDQVSGSFVRSVGYDYQTFNTRLWAGVDPANGDPLWYTDDTRTTTTNNGNLAKQVKFGSATPKYFGGAGTSVNYHGFSLDVQFSFAGGHYQRDNLGSLYLSDGASAARNKVKLQLDRWQKPGDVTNVPRYVVNGNKSSNLFSTRYLYPADHFRLRNLQLGYALSSSLAKRLHLEGANFYVRGTNLLTLVKDKTLPWDPEQGISGEFGADVYIPKTISIGLNLSF